jgi:hypothetical protein
MWVKPEHGDPSVTADPKVAGDFDGIAWIGDDRAVHWYKGGDLGASPNLTLNPDGTAGPSDLASALIIFGSDTAKLLYIIGDVLSFGLFSKW